MGDDREPEDDIYELAVHLLPKERGDVFHSTVDNEPRENFVYELPYDSVRALSRKKYWGRRKAEERFREICQKHNLTPVGRVFNTARHWVLRVLDGRETK